MKVNQDQWNKINAILLMVIVEGFFLYGVAMELIEYPGLLYTYPYLALLGLLVVKICIQNNSWKEWIASAIVLGIGFLSWHFSGDRSSLLFALAICGCKYADLDRLLKIDVAVRTISVIVHIFLPFTGMIVNNVDVIIGGRPRTFLGWGHPNGMGISFLMICAEWICLRHRKMRWFEYAGITGLVVFLDLTANSRTSEAVILLLLLLEVISTKLFREEEKELFFWRWISSGTLLVSILMPVIGTVISLVLGYSTAEKLGTMGSRFILTDQFIKNHGFTLFGCGYIAEQNEYLDMLFANCFLRRGLLFGILVLILCILAIWRGVKKKNISYLILLFVMFLLGAAEQEHVNLIYSVFPVLLGISIWDLSDRK